MRKLIILTAAVFAVFLAFGPGLARGAVDTGFRPDRDGFGFPNFGDAERVAGIDLNALAGTDFHDDIFCHTGHCFGMARACVENFLNGTASIAIPEGEAMPYIDRVQTGQSFYYIGDFFSRPFGDSGLNNSGEYARLLARLSAGLPAVIGIYPSAGDHPGHAVVAYRIDRDGDRSYIYVYDPNLPATLHDYDAEPMVAVFDAANGTFYYDNGRAFDEMRLDDVDGSGIELGKTVSAGMIGLPCTALAALLVMRPRSPRRP
jgi:hypothetical protein